MNYGLQVTCGDLQVLWKRLKAVRVAQTTLQCALGFEVSRVSESRPEAPTVCGELLVAGRVRAFPLMRDETAHEWGTRGPWSELPVAGQVRAFPLMRDKTAHE